MKRVFTLLAALLLTCGLSWAQNRAEEVLATCLFGANYNQQSVGSYTATWTTTNGDYSWTVVNGNNNNNNWNYVKFGRKNNASVGTITTSEAYDDAISKVELTIDAITASSVNSIKLYTSEDNSEWDEVGSFTKAAGTQTVTLADPADNLYYKVEFDCASGGANGLVTVSKVEYYYNTGGANSPTITADNVELAYDATEGTINFTVNNPTENGQMTVSENVDWISNAAVSPTAANVIVFEVEENEGGADRYGVITLTYTYGNDYVSTDVTVTQAANPNAPGTENNPYTVEQAIAAIDSGTGTQGVYATGIVSSIPYSYTSNNGITFNMVDNTGDNVSLQAYKCQGDEAPNVAVGDVAVVYGNLTKYNTTYEFSQGCTLVSLTHPSGFVTAPEFSIPAGGYAEPQSVEILSASQNDVIYYTLDGTDPTNASTQYSNAIEVAETTTIKAIAYNGNNSSEVVTATYYILSENNVLTVTEALGFDEYPANNVFVTGIVSTAPTQAPTSSGQMTYYISEDGEATDELEVYKGKGLNGAAFTAQDDLQVGDVVTVFGNVIVFTPSSGDQIIEFSAGNYLVSFERPGNTEPSITIDPATYEVSADGGEEQLTIVCTNFTPDATQGFTVMFCDAEGNAIDTPEWISAEEVQYEYESGACSVIINFEENETEESRTAYFMVMYGDYVSNMVTFTQAGYVAPFDSVTYTLATSIESGKSYIIVGCKTINEETTYYAMGEQKNTNRSGVLISVDGTTATVSTADVHEVVITALEDAAGFYSIYDGGYLYAAGSNANQLKTKAELDVNGQWAINIEDGAFSIVASESSNRNVMQFNYNGGNPLFNCYSSASQSPVYLYVKDGGNIIDVVDELIVEVPEENDIYIVHDGAVLTLTGEVPDTWDESHIIVEDGGELFHDAAVPATLKKDIVGYNGKGVTGYYLVAAPVYNPFASDYAYPIPAALLSSLGGVEFDLYMFDESAEKEWLNYKDESNPFNGNLHVGVGYLFSYNISKIAEFPGMTIPTSTNFTVKLQKTTGATFSGLNLVGNPYTATAFLADGRDFYVLNDDGDIVKSTKAKIEPVQGLFVVANNNNEDLIFTTTEPSKCAALNIDLSQNNALVDVASINFNKTSRLEKFQLNPNHTKIFFSEAGKDYASIDANSSDAMTLNFKAEYDGTYTISVNVKDIEMGYLHLIDNMTGADIDLLANPSYSFNAKVSDYASRFRLVFSANGESNDANFAFMSNGNLIVNGQGTLQVIDMTGRVVSTEIIDGVSSIEMSAATGVYVVRLTNGNIVKTQKIVVK